MKVHIADTTLRDGEQAPGCKFSIADKLAVAEQLLRLRVDVIEAGFPVSSPGEFRAVEEIARTVGQDAHAPVICGFARSVGADIESAWNAVKAARRPRLHTFLASSDLHLEHKLRMTRAQALDVAARGIRTAVGFCRDVQFSPEDAFRSDRSFLREMIEVALDAGATTINITDTVGYATPWEFGDLIQFVRANVRGINRATLSAHCHDDLGMAVVNSLAAVRAGAQQVECTINGIGERAGNCALEEIVMAIKTRHDFFQAHTDVDATQLIATSRVVSERTGMTVAANKSIVGRNAFAHASGVHQDGVLKHKQTYEIMRPEDVGAGQTWLPLTARSGKSAIVDRFRQMGKVISPDQVDHVMRRFKQMADNRQFVSDQDLLGLI